MKAGTNIRFTRVPKDRFQASYLSANINPSWVAGIGRRNMPGSAFCTVPGCNIPAVATGFQAGYADAWLNILGVLSQANLRANYNKDGTPQAPGSPVSREIASDEYEWYIQDAWQLRPNLTITAGVRYSLYSPPYETNGLQVAPSISMGQWFDQRVENMQERHPVERQRDRHVRSRRPEEQQAGLLCVGQEQLRAARGGGVDAGRTLRGPRRVFEGLRSRRSRSGDDLRRKLRIRDVDSGSAAPSAARTKPIPARAS